jgi:protein NrfD
VSERALKPAFWITGALFLALGIFGWYDRLANGHQNVNYTTLVPWGLWIAGYIYFIGLSAGSFLISSLVYVFHIRRFESIGRLALFSAVVTLLLALLMVWADLGHMERAWEVLAYPNFRSPMAWMIWLYSAYFILILAELWLLLRRDLVVGAEAHGFRGRLYRILSFGSRDRTDASAARDMRLVRVLGTIGIPVAIMFHGGVGALFGVVAARPLWHSGNFPILFLLSALTSGGALLTLISAFFQDGWHRNRETVLALGRLVLGLLLLDLLFQFSEMLVAFYGAVPDAIWGFEQILAGPYWFVFWIGQILIGSLVPIALLSLPTRRDARWVSFAGLLIMLGFLSVRLNIVVPGLAQEEVRGLANAIASARVSNTYLPSATEWLLALGIAGFGLLLFGLGELLLPREKVVEEVARVHA